MDELEEGLRLTSLTGSHSESSGPLSCHPGREAAVGNRHSFLILQYCNNVLVLGSNTRTYKNTQRQTDYIITF